MNFDSSEKVPLVPSKEVLWVDDLFETYKMFSETLSVSNLTGKNDLKIMEVMHKVKNRLLN